MSLPLFLDKKTWDGVVHVTLVSPFSINQRPKEYAHLLLKSRRVRSGMTEENEPRKPYWIPYWNRRVNRGKSG